MNFLPFCTKIHIENCYLITWLQLSNSEDNYLNTSYEGHQNTSSIAFVYTVPSLFKNKIHITIEALSKPDIENGVYVFTLGVIYFKT
jgi:hypothetical protein